MERGTLKSPHTSIVIEKVDEIPDPPPRGLVVKTRFCGLCHSDIMWRDNANENDTENTGGFKIKFPLVLGHEVSGEVYKLGSDIDREDLKVGDDVIVYPWIACSECEDCREDRMELCSGESNEVGFESPGGYGSYVTVVHSRYVVKLPASVPMDVACNLPCSALTTFHAISKVKPFLEGEKGQKHLLVIGAGGLGFWCLQLAKACFPKGTHIVSADIQKDKLDTALKYGADDVILWDIPKDDASIKNDDFVRQMKQKSDGGFHAIIDLVNSSSTAPRAIQGLRKGGALAMVGLFGGVVQMDLRLAVRKRINIFGILVGSFSNFVKLVDLVSHAEIKFPPITHFSLAELNDALEKLSNGKIIGKGVIKY